MPSFCFTKFGRKLDVFSVDLNLPSLIGCSSHRQTTGLRSFFSGSRIIVRRVDIVMEATLTCEANCVLLVGELEGITSVTNCLRVGGSFELVFTMDHIIAMSHE